MTDPKELAAELRHAAEHETRFNPKDKERTLYWRAADALAEAHDSWQRANGVADLAMKHRDIAEAEAARLTAQVAEQRAHIQTISDDNDDLRARLAEREKELTTARLTAKLNLKVATDRGAEVARLAALMEKARACLIRLRHHALTSNDMAAITALLAELTPKEPADG
jgi:uncharacterized membrane protein